MAEAVLDQLSHEQTVKALQKLERLWNTVEAQKQEIRELRKRLEAKI